MKLAQKNQQQPKYLYEHTQKETKKEIGIKITKQAKDRDSKKLKTLT